MCLSCSYGAVYIGKMNRLISYKTCCGTSPGNTNHKHTTLAVTWYTILISYLKQSVNFILNVDKCWLMLYYRNLKICNKIIFFLNVTKYKMETEKNFYLCKIMFCCDNFCMNKYLLFCNLLFINKKPFASIIFLLS